MKKFFAILLSAMLMLSLAVPASAASITIDGGASGSEYAAYKLLNATNSGTLFAYTLNEKYTSILQTATGETEQAGIIAYIQELDAAGIRTFADAVYAAITTANLSADYTSVDDSVENDAANIFESVDQGYYLIAETKVGNSADTKSLVMLNTAGDEALTVTTKEDTLTGESLTELVVKDVTGAEVKDFTVTVSSGKIETDIVNQSGTELPETGGMGTTIFYIVGGIMVVAAVVLLVTKKRMSE